MCENFHFYLIMPENYLRINPMDIILYAVELWENGLFTGID